MKNYLKIIIILVVSFNLAACTLEDKVIDEEKKEAVTETEACIDDTGESIEETNEQENWIVVDDILLGGTVENKWVDANEIEKFINGGENYNLYKFEGKLGEAKGEDIELLDPCSTQSVSIKTNQQFDVAITGQWDAIPRPIKTQSSKNKEYKKIVSELLKEKGLQKPDITIVQNYRVDLEGDGIDEVLINASNLNYDNPIPPMYKGDYNIIILRKIIKGKVNNIILHECIGLKDPDFEGDSDNPYKLQIVGKIIGIIDANGDGIMEFIIGAKYYEGYGYTLYEIKDNTPQSIIGNGWGV